MLNPSPFTGNLRMHQRHLLATLFLATATLSATTVSAQSTNPLVGTWNVEYEVGRRMEDGHVTGIIGQGTLKIEASGDSLVGTLQAPPRPDGSVVPVAKFGGRGANGTVVLSQKLSAKVSVNGEMNTAKLTAA